MVQVHIQRLKSVKSYTYGQASLLEMQWLKNGYAHILPSSCLLALAPLPLEDAHTFSACLPWSVYLLTYQLPPDALTENFHYGMCLGI